VIAGVELKVGSSTQAPSPSKIRPKKTAKFRIESFENFSSKVNDLR
jgi:hypothetical protein